MVKQTVALRRIVLLAALRLSGIVTRQYCYTGVVRLREGMLLDKTVPLSVIAALLVVGGALYALQSFTSMAPRPAAVVNKTAGPASNGVSSPKQSGQIVGSQRVPQSGAINKCIVGSQTIYSDQPCAASAKSVAVDIQDTAGIEPPKVKREVAYQEGSNQSEQFTNGRGGVIGLGNGSSRCAELTRDIERWDAMARLPQPASTQDWIRGRRLAVRNEQNAAGC